MSIFKRINLGPCMHRVIVAAPEGQAHFAGAPLLLLPVADLQTPQQAPVPAFLLATPFKGNRRGLMEVRPYRTNGRSFIKEPPPQPDSIGEVVSSRLGTLPLHEMPQSASILQARVHISYCISKAQTSHKCQDKRVHLNSTFLRGCCRNNHRKIAPYLVRILYCMSQPPLYSGSRNEAMMRLAACLPFRSAGCYAANCEPLAKLRCRRRTRPEDNHESVGGYAKDLFTVAGRMKPLMLMETG